MQRKGLLIMVKVLVLTLLLIAGGCSKHEQPAAGATVQVMLEPRGSAAVLSVFAADERPTASGSSHKNAQGKDVKKQVTQNTQTAYFHVELVRSGKGVAYIAKVGDKLRVVHNGKPGKLYGDIDATKLAVSQDGQHVAYGASYGSSQGAGSAIATGIKWFIVRDGIEIGPFDALGPPVFSPDGQHIAFECKIGERWKMFVDTKSFGDAFSYIDKPLFSSDSKMLLFGETGEASRTPRVVFTDLEFKQQRVIEQGGGPLAVSPDLTRAAAIQEHNNKRRVVEFALNLTGKVKEGALYDEISSMVFSADGTSLVYRAKRGDATFLIMNGKEERLPEGEYPWPPVIKPGNAGVGIAIVGKDGAYLYQAFGGGGASAQRYREIADVVYSSDGKIHAYVAIKNDQFLIVVNDKEGPVYDRVISPQLSPDGKFLVYRARRENSRFVVVADATGKVISEHPGYQRVFETTFTKDGESVAYGAIDEKQIMWKVEKL